MSLTKTTTNQNSCDRCVALNIGGERCLNHTCIESNKPLCRVHTDNLSKIVTDFNELSPAHRLLIMNQLSQYLDRRNIDFVVNLIIDERITCPLRLAKTKLWCTNVLDIFNAMSIQSKRRHLASFTTYMCSRGAEYQLQLKEIPVA
jgi:hypothetical protein